MKHVPITITTSFHFQLALLLLTALALCLASCAGSGIDRDFRSKVSGSTTTIGGTYDSANQSGGATLTHTLQFRDPSKD